jgi:murein DD-endopeptidase MepM/ murein hydrolase activator NlpD
MLSPAAQANLSTVVLVPLAVRPRCLIFLCVLAAALAGAGAANAYPWPVKPFKKQHPIRANFGDPRTVFELTLFQNGIEGPGSFLFHNGIDIAAPDGTPVYPVMSGTVKLFDAESLSVDTGKGRIFQYFHIVPEVADDQHVVAGRTVLGRIGKGYGHVHLGEIRGDRIWNPVAKGGIAPYRDTIKPTIASVEFRPWNTMEELDPLGVCGEISIVSEAFDTPQLKIAGNFANFPLSPALVTWTLRRVGSGEIVSPPTNAADFRGTLPLVPDFWNVYARGTYQNAPRFANRQFALMPGRYIYQLTPQGLDTRTLPNGVYQVTVRAADIKGNATTVNRRFTVANQAGTLTGCPAPPPRHG